MFADVCVGQITGFKTDSYKLGLQGLINFLNNAND
jgi:3-dehydroquinate dehydratase